LGPTGPGAAHAEPSVTSEADRTRRFGGVARVYGEAAARRFAESSVCVIGLGGVGSWTVEALARSGIGALTLIDLDHVAESNVNRQLPALGSTLGRAKAAVLAERALDINPALRVEVVEDFVLPGTLARLVGPCFHQVVDCIDDFRAKAALVAHCRRQKTALVTVGGAGGRVDPTRVRVGDLSRSVQDRLLSRVRKQLRQEYGFSRNPRRRFDVPCVWSDEQMVFPGTRGGVCPGRPAGSEARDLSCAGGIGSVVTVTATFGLVAAAHVLNRLARRAEGRPTLSGPVAPPPPPPGPRDAP
jgi:tRNA A37 threonylcarbamoyladenosine dehydratase